MLSVSRVIELIGGKFKGRAEFGYDNYVYDLPNGDTVTAGGHGRWWYLDQCGEGSESLFQLANPRVEAFRSERNRLAEEKATKRYEAIRAKVERLAEHLSEIEWDETVTFETQANEFRKFPNLCITVPRGRHEVWIEFNDDGSILHGCAGTTSFTGIPSMNKAFAKWYEFRD